MTRLTLLENDVASLWWYPDEKIIHHQFRAFTCGEQFCGVLEKGLEAFREYGASKWLSDDRGHCVVTDEDTEWVIQSWSPRVIAAGWKHWAVVVPAKVVGQMSMRRWIKRFEAMGITVQAFTDPDEAMAWLERQ